MQAEQVGCAMARGGEALRITLILIIPLCTELTLQQGCWEQDGKREKEEMTTLIARARAQYN